MSRDFTLVLLALVCVGCSASTPGPVSYRLQGPPPSDPGALIPPAGMTWVPESVFLRGSDVGLRSERPAHRVLSGGFWIETTEVTVARFRRFIEATGYQTSAELPRAPVVLADLDLTPSPSSPGIEGEWPAGGLVFRGEQSGRPATWIWLRGASWHHPEGPSGPAAAAEDPVTQVSLVDALAFAEWAGLRLPTAAEWELSAHGGAAASRFPWGSSDHLGGQARANVWSGEFPSMDRGRDGYRGVCAVRSFPANGLGIHDMAGNVWEWTSDAWTPNYQPFVGGGLVERPSKPHMGRGAQPAVIKGGSFLSPEGTAEPDYRSACRRAWPANLGRSDLGFRLVLDPAMRWAGSAR